MTGNSSHTTALTPPSPAVRVVGIIQARMGSTRCPGKTLAILHDKPFFLHLLERLRAAGSLEKLVLATTRLPEDDGLAQVALEQGIGVYRGDVNDVLDRYYQAARIADAQVIVRITADDPFKDPEVIDQAVKLLLDGGHDYCSNTISPSFPEGLDIEVFTFAALQQAHREARLQSEREHVTPFIWKQPARFKSHNFKCDRDLQHLRWTIDYPEDMQFAREIYKRLYPAKKVFTMRDIIAVLEQEPELGKINEGIVRNESYLKTVNQEMTSMSAIVQRVGERERTYTEEVIRGAFRSSGGARFMTKLEEEFAAKFGSKFGISMVNGTATMHAALEAAGIGAGDEVIVPPLTMSSTSLAVLHANATPVFADVDPKTWTIDPGSIAANITDKTKGIITVALYGLSPDMDPIMELARKHNLFVIEDNAEAFLSSYKGRMVGTLGHCSSFSFQSSKHMTSGEGGIVLTDDEALAGNMRKAAGLGYTTLGAKKAKIRKEEIQHPSFLRHDYLGWNYRMSELCCAFALGQLEHLDELVQVRVRAGKMYREALQGSTLLTPQHIPEGYVSSEWTTVCLLDTGRVTWEAFRKKFQELGGHAYYAAWTLSYLEPLFLKRLFGTRERLIHRHYAPGLCPVAESLQPRLIQLKTSFWDASQAEQQAGILAKTVRSFE